LTGCRLNSPGLCLTTQNNRLTRGACLVASDKGKGRNLRTRTGTSWLVVLVRAIKTQDKERLFLANRERSTSKQSPSRGSTHVLVTLEGSHTRNRRHSVHRRTTSSIPFPHPSSLAQDGRHIILPLERTPSRARRIIGIQVSR